MPTRLHYIMPLKTAEFMFWNAFQKLNRCTHHAHRRLRAPRSARQPHRPSRRPLATMQVPPCACSPIMATMDCATITTPQPITPPMPPCARLVPTCAPRQLRITLHMYLPRRRACRPTRRAYSIRHGRLAKAAMRVLCACRPASPTHMPPPRPVPHLRLCACLAYAASHAGQRLVSGMAIAPWSPDSARSKSTS